MIRLAIFGSGSGSNALNIIEQCKGRHDIQVALIICNVEGAGILQHAKNHGIPSVVIANNELKTEEPLIHVLQEHHVNWIVLAGFLRKIGSKTCQAFPNKILNIHPALLPKYGGKGMYGHFVHEAVYENKERQSGITIHFVNEHYDDGNIIAQFTADIDSTDSPKEIETKVRELEIAHFPSVIFETILK